MLGAGSTAFGVQHDEREMLRGRRRFGKPEFFPLHVSGSRPLDERQSRRRAERVQHDVLRTTRARPIDDLAHGHRRPARRYRVANTR